MAEAEATRPHGRCRPGDPDGADADRALAGDVSAQNRLREKYGVALIHATAKKLNDEDAAGLGVDAAFESAFSVPEGFPGKTSFFTWLQKLVQQQVAEQDAALVRLALSGEESAYKSLHDRHSGRIMGLAVSMLRDSTAARDAVEAAFADAFTKLDTFRGDASFYTWLYRIALRRIAGQKKVTDKESNTVSLDDTRTGTSDGLPMAESIVAPRAAEPDYIAQRKRRYFEIVRATHNLSEKLREVYYMTLLDLETSEIAEILGASEMEVRTYISRGREKLREMLRQDMLK